MQNHIHVHRAAVFVVRFSITPAEGMMVTQKERATSAENSLARLLTTLALFRPKNRTGPSGQRGGRDDVLPGPGLALNYNLHTAVHSHDLVSADRRAPSCAECKFMLRPKCSTSVIYRTDNPARNVTFIPQSNGSINRRERHVDRLTSDDFLTEIPGPYTGFVIAV